MSTSATIIRATARRHRLARLVRWKCLGAIALLAPLAGLAWLDSLFVLSPAWRWTALVLAVGALLGAIASFSRACHRPSSAEAARVLDRASGLPGGYAVSTSRELTDKAPADAVEGELLANLHAAAARLAEDARPVHPWPGKVTLIAASASTVAFLAIAIREDGLAVRRALQPWLNLPYTTIELRGPAESPVRREPFAVTGTVSGRIPKELHLTWTGGRSATVALNPDGSFTHALALGLLQSSDFAATAAADGRSAPLTVALRRTPKISEYRFDITPPSYTGWPVATETRPGFVVLRGSEVTLTVRLDIPAKALAFVPDNNRGKVDATPSDGGKSWTVDLGKVNRTFSYRLEITDEKATLPATPEPQMIVATPDAPPKFASFTHNADKFESENPPEAFTLNYTATDDIGLAVEVINCRALNGKALVPRLFQGIADKPTTHSRTWSVPLKTLCDAGAKPLDIVIITVQVYDTNRLDGPGVVTETVFLEIPFPPAAAKDKKKAEQKPSEGGGSPGDNVNPLALQKELHRRLLRSLLGIKAQSESELAERQQDVVKHLEKMMKSEDAQKLGAKYLGHLRKAKEAAATAVTALKTPPPRFMIGPPASYSGNALAELIMAAQIEAAAEKEDKDPSDGKDPSGPAETKYSLIRPPSGKPDKADDDEAKKNEEIEKALNTLDQLRGDQDKLNKDAAKLDAKKDGDKPGDKSGDAKDGDKPGDKPGRQPGQSPGQSPGQQPGQSPGQGRQPGQGQQPGQSGQPGQSSGKPGDRQGQPSDQQPGRQPPPSAEQLAAKQAAMSSATNGLLKGVAAFDGKDRQADPKQVAAALRTAKEFQDKTAAALRASDLAQARQFGAKSVEALDAAGILTRALLEKQVRRSIEAQAPAPGFETIIQEYSRRISYD